MPILRPGLQIAHFAIFAYTHQPICCASEVAALDYDIMTPFVGLSGLSCYLHGMVTQI